MKEIVTKSDKASSTSLPVQDPSKGSLGASKESTKKSWQVSSPLSLRGNKSERTGADVVKSLRFVIFPDNKWIKKWDLIVLAGLFLLIFILPYQIGVSGGITLLQRFLWFVFNVLLNSIFFVDTFLYFLGHTTQGVDILFWTSKKFGGDISEPTSFQISFPCCHSPSHST